MKRGVRWVIGGVAAISATAWAAGEGQIQKLDLQPGAERTTLVISHSGEGKFRLFKSEKQGSVIIEAENLALPPALTKMVDVSASGGPVFQMTPYNSQHSGHSMAKLVLQLKGRADVSSTDLPGKFLVEIARVNGAVPAVPSQRDELKSHLSAAQKGEAVAKRLIDVLNSNDEDKKYFGTKVTFEAKDAEVPDIFRLVGESSDLNIIWDQDVEGQKTSLSVKDLPWDQLLDIVVQQKGYKAAVMGNVVRIMTVDTFNKQAEAKKRELTLSDDLEPVIMAVIPLGFVQASDMKSLIKNLIEDKASSGGGAGGAGGVGGAAAGGAAAAASASSSDGTKLSQDFKRGQIATDDRTNSLVITNTKDAIERIRRLVKELDVPVPQVLIDAKIVIASDNFSRSVGASWKGNLQSESRLAGGGVAFNNQSVQFGGSGTTGEDTTSAFQISAAQGGDSVFGIKFGATDRATIGAALELAEINGTSKTIASPRVIVNNNTEASISDGTTITQLVPGGSSGSSGSNTVKPQLSLSVTPQVTSHGSIQMKKLTVTKDLVNSFTATTTSLDNKSIKTDILVDSGSTLVLGGIYQMQNSLGVSGIPLLKDLPFIGQLFRINSSQSAKSELMVFVTPQIIDPEASSQSL
jgi:type IV pilus assembly protein PilQ